MSIKPRGARLTYKFENMRTDWLLLEEQRLDKRQLQEGEQFSQEDQVALNAIRTELDKRQENGRYTTRSDFAHDEIINESYW